MHFAFVRPPQYSHWGGDLKAIQDLQEGLHLLGQTSFLTHELGLALAADQIFFIGTLTDHSPHLHFMQLARREYGCIPFHEDHLLYSGASFGFPYYISQILNQSVEENVPFSLEHLYERPHLIFYYDRMRPVNALQNYEFLKNARHIIASSPTEQKTLLRDVPTSSPEIVLWGAGHARTLSTTPDTSFLSFTGLSSGSYILQVGRLSSRKNQLATLLATKDLDAPLVFIAMDKCTPAYEHLLITAAIKWRKAPTILISQHLPASCHPPLTIIPTPHHQILPQPLLLSAFAHAGLHMHPSFYELPGYTYFESARFGIPTIASHWTSLKDYFTPPLDTRIEYALPYDLPTLTTLAQKKFGQKYSEYPLHPIYQRTAQDIAEDFLARLGLRPKPR